MTEPGDGEDYQAWVELQEAGQRETEPVQDSGTALMLEQWAYVQAGHPMRSGQQPSRDGSTGTTLTASTPCTMAKSTSALSRSPVLETEAVARHSPLETTPTAAWRLRRSRPPAELCVTRRAQPPTRSFGNAEATKARLSGPGVRCSDRRSVVLLRSNASSRAAIRPQARGIHASFQHGG
jgi:hypothetical protein